MKFLGGFKAIKGRFSNAINEGGQGLKIVGKFIKPIAEKVNLATALINTPLGQAALYGVGSLFGPAGLAAASGINAASKALYIATSIGLGVDNVVGGLNEVNKGNYLGGAARTGVGLLGSLTGVGRLGKVRILGLEGSSGGQATRANFTANPLGERISSKIGSITNAFKPQGYQRFTNMNDYYNPSKFSQFATGAKSVFGQIGSAGKSTGKWVADYFGPGEVAEVLSDNVKAPSAALEAAKRFLETQ